MATKAQIRALRYLLDSGMTEGIDSTVLASLYQHDSDLNAIPLRVVAWKRISGANMALMARAGLLERDRLTHSREHYRIEYRFTEAGREAAR